MPKMTKVAKNTKEAQEIQNIYKDQSHGWLQWKGTDACMDIHCECGTSSHIDADFLYHVVCPNCGAVYFCNGHIELIEITEEKITTSIHVDGNRTCHEKKT